MKSLHCILILLAFTFNSNSQVWNQKGIDMDGEAAHDESGTSVSMADANTVAIGAPYNNGNGWSSGQVRIYKWSGGSWIQKGNDIDGEAANDLSGHAVSMPDSNTVAIGASYNNGAGTSAGHVRIYNWSGSTWVQKGNDIDGEAVGDHSGYSVCMPDSNTVAIGAPYNDGTDNASGHVRIYKWTGGVWVQKGSDIDGEDSLDRSGITVSMPDSNTVAIGAPYNDGNGSNAGQVRVYRWNGSTWLQKGIDIDGESIVDYSGCSVSMSDSNTVAIGAPSNGLAVGQVRVYSWNGNAWVQKGNDINGESMNDYSGFSVSMADSNSLAIGAPYNNGGLTSAGHTRIYQWNGNNWVQTGQDIDGEANGDSSGFSVSMHDLNSVAIGAFQNDGNGLTSGHVRIYSFCNSYKLIFVNTCDSYTSPSGNYTWQSSGVYEDTIPNTGGCDSILTINLSISNSSASTTSINACGSYLSPSGNYLWQSTGTYQDTIANVAGCDSILTIDLTISNSSNSTTGITACKSYTSPSGNYLWQSTGTYQDTITNGVGCDSILTINLTIDTVNTAVINNSPTLTAVATGAVYQWVDCNNNFAIINGAASQSFTASVTGNYAVIVTQNNCTDTSGCQAVNGVGILENSFGHPVALYPNPTTGELKIDFGKLTYTGEVTIFNTLGQQTGNFRFDSQNAVDVYIEGEAGVYLVEVKDSNHKKVLMEVVKK